jgi:hypothetical protein
VFSDSAAKFESTNDPRNDEKELETYRRYMHWMEKYKSDLTAFYRVEAKDAGKQVFCGCQVSVVANVF